jgi:hypothetical protein
MRKIRRQNRKRQFNQCFASPFRNASSLPRAHAARRNIVHPLREAGVAILIAGPAIQA